MEIRSIPVPALINAMAHDTMFRDQVRRIYGGAGPRVAEQLLERAERNARKLRETVRLIALDLVYGYTQQKAALQARLAREEAGV
ncbi:MAG: hypothetical protein KGL39_43230 [Patescibacteria group bacterium]|nr:hypothetical protein [Patescibacteria group bacterium]